MAEDSGRCVLTLPLLTEPYQEHILEKRFRIAEHLQNSLIAKELRKLKQVERTREYRELMEQIRETPTEKQKPLWRKRNQILKQAGFSEYAFKDDMTPMQKHFVEHFAAQISHKLASDVWNSFQKCLFGSGHEVHFKRRGSLASIANQKAGNGMVFKDGVFKWGGGQCPNKVTLSIRVAEPETEYEKKMLEKPVKYFRVIRKWMKNRYKYYLQFTLVGEPVQKKRATGKGRVGIDIGTQSIAIASAQRVELLELADGVNDNHRKLLAIQRKMDRSRRRSNPDNYNPDGTIRRGIKLYWNKSKRYERLAGQARELQRKNADIRKYQHTCLANHILSLGTEVYVEDMNYHALQLRAKKTTKDAKGRFNRKKRFGKSLANKAPAMFLTILATKLGQLPDGSYAKVDKWEYRASQYDHLGQKYNKKSLSTRNFQLENGDRVQRDLYAAFLLMNADETLTRPDQTRCEQTYSDFKLLHDAEIHRLRQENRNHLSSFGVA